MTTRPNKNTQAILAQMALNRCSDTDVTETYAKVIRAHRGFREYDQANAIGLEQKLTGLLREVERRQPISFLDYVPEHMCNEMHQQATVAPDWEEADRRWHARVDGLINGADQHPRWCRVRTFFRALFRR